ncbi:hypothetical protein [Mariniphaga sp.]|uniref:hypothetical protein n=1 Tax=Mariniphaga sp. TaxID=1954475 RepID=UPI003568B04B
MKRNLVIVVIIILAAATGYFYFTNRSNPFLKDTSVYRAVPVSAPFFFELNSIRSIPFENSFVNELEKAGIGANWFSFLHEADSLILGKDNLPKSLRNTSFLLAYGTAGRNELVPLLITNSGSNSRENALTEFIETVYPPEIFNYYSRDYGKHQITEITDNNNKEILFFSFADDLLLASNRAIIIEQAIRQLSTNGIQNNPYFLEVNRNSSSQDVSLFINHNWINSFFTGVLNRKAFEKADEFGVTTRFQFTSNAEKFREFAAWSELGFQFKDGQLVLNGTSAADDSLNHFMSVFDNQQPVRSKAEEILPYNTSFFCSFSFSDKKSYFEKLEEFYIHSPAYYHREERMKRFDRGFRANVRKVFQDMVKDEVIAATTTIPVDPSNKTTLFILHTEGRSATEERLQNLMANYATLTETEINNLFSDFSTDNETKFRIYRFPYPSFPGLWMGSPFELADARFVTVYDNLLVFSNTEQGLQEYLLNMVRGSTLARDNGYQQFRQTRLSRTNINVFVDVNKAFSLRNEIFATGLLKQIEEKEETLRRFGMVNWQIQRNKNSYLNSLAIDFQTETDENAQTTWQSQIGSDIATKPLLVINHTDKANREIIFQDVQQNLHLISGSGFIRWTVPLPGPVLSEIKQVDYYKNGRLQFLFNTKDKLYLIDRNGNNVAHFPITLKSPATNGVNVFDYYNNRDYRYFVAGEDRKIYAYDFEGKIISGWIFGQTDSEVVTPVQHFRISGNDYIVFKDNSKIYIQDRQGETRVPVSKQFTNSKNPLVFNLNGTPKIVATDSGGKVYYLYFDGKVEEKKTARFSENHFFTADDLDGNDIPDFVFVDGSEVTVMDENGKKLFSQKLDNPIGHQPNIYTFATDLKKVGVTDATSNHIYLFNPDGKLHQGFPLFGNSEFTIGKLSDSSTGLNLVVGSEGGKLYNYTLN